MKNRFPHASCNGTNVVERDCSYETLAGLIMLVSRRKCARFHVIWARRVLNTFLLLTTLFVIRVKTTRTMNRDQVFRWLLFAVIYMAILPRCLAVQLYETADSCYTA